MQLSTQVNLVPGSLLLTTTLINAAEETTFSGASQGKDPGNEVAQFQPPYPQPKQMAAAK